MNEPLFWIDKEGRWFYQGEEITHRRTYLLYARNLTLDGEGRPLLRVGKEECRVEVEDAPYVVKSVDFICPEGGTLKGIDLLLNDETREALQPGTLKVGEQNVLYCRVRGGIVCGPLLPRRLPVAFSFHPARRKRQTILPPSRRKGI